MWPYFLENWCGSCFWREWCGNAGDIANLPLLFSLLFLLPNTRGLLVFVWVLCSRRAVGCRVPRLAEAVQSELPPCSGQCRQPGGSGCAIHPGTNKVELS